jgi:putative nucleotidyltransferase with HDIG domain
MNDSLRLYVQKISKLPTIPIIAQEILNIVDDDLASINKLENIIEKDPAISAKILSVANSAFFGYQTPSVTVTNAIIRIGVNNVRNIALGISLMTVFIDEKPIHSVDAHYQRIFKHSLAVGMVARQLSRELKINISDEIFINGILHDLGFMVLNRYFPQMFLNVLGEFRKIKCLLDAEKKILGFTHADIGMWLADKWNLPEDIIDTTLYHHTPLLARSNQDHVALMHIADYITTKNVFNITETDPDYPLDMSTFDILGISENDFNEIETTINKEMLSDEIFN